MWRNILIVEDHSAVRRGLRSLLELEFPQIHIVEASSGDEGVMRSILEPPQLVVMDISLPGLNGIEATRQIKCLYPSVPIVIFTVHEDEIYRAEAEAAGANAYISKLGMKYLISAISTFLEHGPDTNYSEAKKL